jgi:hypothetical protein
LRCALVACAASTLAAADDAPAWLTEAAAAVPPVYGPGVKAVVLLDDEQVVVEEGGKITTTRRRAVRILSRSGRTQAVGRVVYQTGTGKVTGMRGWMVWPGGRVLKYGKDRVIDAEAAPNDVFNEVRTQAIVAADDAVAGAVFGCESVLQDRSVFTQFEWSFQEELPTLFSRFTISFPPGWRADGRVYNRTPFEPAAVGTSYTWVVRDLPPIEREPMSPALTSIAPWLAVSLTPAPGARTGLGKTFEGWPDVARWLSELADPQTRASDELAEKAHNLARGARSEFERIQAVARYVQGVRYVSIQTGLGRGGGYKPHPADEVFAKSYGDCKDKANLMRAMLKVVGIESFPLAVFAGDPSRVRPDWPSPQQFNHAIVAVRLKDALELPGVGSQPGLGRLLFFDPTDEQTPLGFLPQHEEGGQGLLVSPDQGGLLRLPASPPEANRVTRRLELSLAGDGALAGKMEEEAYGHAAAAYRREHQRGGHQRRMEDWVARAAGSGAQVESLEVTEEGDATVRVVAQFVVPRYARLLHETLMVARADVLPIGGHVSLTESSRKYPLVLEPTSFEETESIQLPAGFVVDEMPSPVRETEPFGTYSSSAEVRERRLSYRRSLTVAGTVVPVDQYSAARRFFNLATRGDQAVVLTNRPRLPSR